MNWWLVTFGIGVPVLGLIIWFAWPSSNVDRLGNNGPHRYERTPDRGVAGPSAPTLFIERSPLAGREPFVEGVVPAIAKVPPLA